MIGDKLEWEEKYSVGIESIDNQHKKLFEAINKLIKVVSEYPKAEKLAPVVESILEYKKFHFATEEKYFREFNYEGAEEHIKLHVDFGEKLEKIKMENQDNIVSFAYALLDFLEDWLVSHLMTADQKYVECFKSHGLK